MPATRNTPPGRHSRDGIVEVALRLLDEYGIADLSMRRLATELDVQPSALYWHFENKQSLLAAVADRIVDAETVAGGDLATVAARVRDALLATRDGAEVVMSTYALGLGAGSASEALRAACGIDEPERADAVLHFILGNTAILQQQLHAQRFGVLAADPAVIRADADRAFAAGITALT